MNTAMSLLWRILLLGGLAAVSTHAAPAAAQALGDADCPGGYYFYPAYRVCVPYGYVYVPDYYAEAYVPPVYGPQIYGPTYYFLSKPRDHDADHHHHHDHHHDDPYSR